MLSIGNWGVDMCFGSDMDFRLSFLLVFIYL